MSGTIAGDVSATNSQFSWDIPNCTNTIRDNKKKDGDYIYSPTFCTNHHCGEPSNKILNLHWRMRLDVFDVFELENYVAIGLKNLDDIEVSTSFTIVLVDKLNNKVIHPDISANVICEEQEYLSNSTFSLTCETRCLMQDTLTISCHIHSTSVRYDDRESDEEDCSTTLKNHFDMLFNTGKFSDVKIRIGNHELCLHKSIITSLSPVFRAMFENPMKEQNENVVDIVDIEFNVMKEMLRFMYVRKVNEIEKIASDLFVAADKYCVKGLRRLCETSLCKDLDEHNVSRRLEIAVQYNRKRLKRKTVAFIVKHLKELNFLKEFIKELSSVCKSEILSNIAKNHTESFSTLGTCCDNESNNEDCSAALLNHFDMLFNTSQFSDVIITVGNQELRAHKNIMSFFSPVFQAIFEDEMKEKNKNVVATGDIEFHIMKEMLRYIYSRKVNGIEKIAGDLFAAAGKYSVKGLQQFCEKSLCENLDAENVLQYLEMAVKHNMKKVKHNAIKLILENLKDFDDKPEFKNLSSDCKTELLSYIAKILRIW